MRNKANRYPVRRLFVLGAGASYAATRRRKDSRFEAPLDRDFLKRLEGLNVQRPYWVNEARDRVFAQWGGHRAITDFALEDAILQQLGHLEFIGAMHPRRTKNAPTEFDWLNDITHLICYVMRHTRESSPGVYATFATKVFPQERSPADYEDRVITFNYDDLLDQHIIGRVGVERVYFDKMKQSRGDKSYRMTTFSSPLILKLHGCINWRCEEDEFRGILESKFDDSPHTIPAVWYVGSPTPRPEDEVYPLLVPPLPTKPLSDIRLFRYLWGRAYEYLHEAEELVICGYSLPPADRLAASLFRNFRNSKLREVVIVDPQPAIIAKWQGLLGRPGVSRAKWTYFDDFANYVMALE